MTGAIGKLRREVVGRLLAEQDFILIVVNPACPGVRLPAELLAAPQPVALHVGYRMTVPIPDLTLDDDRLTGTLSFQRTPFPCVIPWAALVQISVDDEHLVWIVPPPAQAPTTDEERPPEERPKLRLV